MNHSVSWEHSGATIEVGQIIHQMMVNVDNSTEFDLKYFGYYIQNSF
jgi:hypothetical protein